jgi:hypothetical protein
MDFREFLFDELIGDLEYHPKRGVLYLGLGAASLCYWIFTPPDDRFSTTPLLFGLGSLALLLKGVFFLRRSSEGIDTSQQGLKLSLKEAPQIYNAPAGKQRSPPVAVLAAQLVQDFGAGPCLSWPLLHLADRANESWDLPALPVFLAGALVFSIGWLLRRFARSQSH